VGNPNLPIIIDDKDYNFHDEFHDIYPTNVFIDNEMKIHAILDTLDTAESVNVRIQEMLDNLETGLSANYKNITPFNFQITNLYPNPFNPVLNIDFDINQAGWVKIIITNIAGSMVQTVHEGYKGVGKHHLSWGSDKLPSGTYFVTLEFESSSLTKKVILLK